MKNYLIWKKTFELQGKLEVELLAARDEIAHMRQVVNLTPPRNKKNYIHNQVESVLGNDKTTKEQLGDEERKKFKWLYSQVEYHLLQK